MPPEETHSQPRLVAASDEAVLHLHHSPPPSAVIGHRDHKRKRRKHDANDGALPPQEFTASRSTLDADRAATEPATPTGGAHRSQRRAPSAERAGAGGSLSKDDKASSPSVAPPPAASSKAIRVKHSSSSFVIGGKQHPAAGSHSEYANSHAAAAPSSSARLIIRGPAALPPHTPAKARRPPSACAAPSAAVPLEPNDDERFRRGVEAFGEWDVAAQQAAVDRFVRQQQQPLPEGGGFSFWLTTKQADDDLEYVHKMVEARRREAASASGKPPRRR